MARAAAMASAAVGTVRAALARMTAADRVCVITVLAMVGALVAAIPVLPAIAQMIVVDRVCAMTDFVPEGKRST
jgi:hypothetical protein